MHRLKNSQRLRQEDTVSCLGHPVTVRHRKQTCNVDNLYLYPGPLSDVISGEPFSGVNSSNRERALSFRTNGTRALRISDKKWKAGTI